VAATGFGGLWLLGRLALGIPPDDFAGDYAMGLALRSGANPYVTISQLTVRYLGFPPEPSWVNDHPPSQLLMSVPMSYLPFGLGRWTWFALSLAALVGIIVVAHRLVGRKTTLIGVVIALLASLSWYPVRRELDLGSTILLVAACVAGAMLAYRSGRQGLAGLLIGLTFWTRLVCWPVLLVFLFRRSWRAASMAVATAAAGALAGGMLVGPATVARFVTRVLPADAALFTGDPANISLAGDLTRVFQGTGPSPFGQVTLPALFNVPGLALPLASAVALVLALAGALAARRLRPDAAVAVGVCIGALAGPLAWNFYLVLVGTPAILVLNARGQQRYVLALMLAALAPTFLFFDGWERVVSRFPPAAYIVPMVGVCAAAAVVLGLVTTAGLRSQIVYASTVSEGA